ncbi:hypothetical protein CT0861_13249, partial [Colletotrichum tofieldiae]
CASSKLELNKKPSIFGLVDGEVWLSLLIVNVSTCACLTCVTEHGAGRKVSLFLFLSPTAVSIATVSRVWPTEGGRERDESLIWDGRKSKGQNLSRRLHSVLRVPHVSDWPSRASASLAGGTTIRQERGKPWWLSSSGDG